MQPFPLIFARKLFCSLKKLILSGLAILFLAVCVIALTGYAKDNQGKLLAEEFFSPVPVRGYGTQRALIAGSRDAAASILRQGIIYHQQQDYDLALVSFRAYFDEVPVREEYFPTVLASTAAFVTGNYEEAREFLDGISQTEKTVRQDYLWYTALLDLRDENFSAARERLTELEGMGQKDYEVKALLGRLPKHGYKIQ